MIPKINGVLVFKFYYAFFLLCHGELGFCFCFDYNSVFLDRPCTTVNVCKNGGSRNVYQKRVI